MSNTREANYQRIPWAVSYQDILGDDIMDSLGWTRRGNPLDCLMLIMKLVDVGRFDLVLALADRLFRDGHVVIYENIAGMSGMIGKESHIITIYKELAVRKPLETIPLCELAKIYLSKKDSREAGVWWRKAFKISPDATGFMESIRLSIMHQDPDSLPPWGEMEFKSEIFMLFPPDIRCEIRAFLLVVLRLGWARLFGLTKDTRLEIIKFVATRGGRDPKLVKKLITIEY